MAASENNRQQIQTNEAYEMSYLRCFLIPVAITAAVIWAGAVSPALAAEEDVKSAETCGEFGTSIEFVDSPADAAKKALEDEKLVFVLHVSGNFETPDYT